MRIVCVWNSGFVGFISLKSSSSCSSICCISELLLCFVRVAEFAELKSIGLCVCVKCKIVYLLLFELTRRCGWFDCRNLSS